MCIPNRMDDLFIIFNIRKKNFNLYRELNPELLSIIACRTTPTFRFTYIESLKHLSWSYVWNPDLLDSAVLLSRGFIDELLGVPSWCSILLISWYSFFLFLFLFVVGIYQIYCIIVKQRFRNSIRDVKTLPGADIDSDHNLLLAEVKNKVEVNKKAFKRKPK